MIQELKVMRGPNIWSIKHHKLIVLKLDLKEIGDVNIDTLESKVGKIFPALLDHNEGGLVKDFDVSSLQTFIPGLMALIAKELQTSSGSNVTFSTGQFVGNVSPYAIFEYQEEEVGTEAAYMAEEIMEALINNKEYKSIEDDIKKLREIHEDVYLGPSTDSIVQAAIERNIPVKKISDGRFIILGQGIHQKRIEGSICETTSSIAVDVAGDKDTTKQLLADALIPVPSGVLVNDQKSLEEAAQSMGYPLVTKPLDGHQGKGITINIKNNEELIKGYELAKEYSRSVILERSITGRDYRFLVVGYKLAAAALRKPASVIGDGKSTIAELIEEVNKHPHRSSGHSNILTKIHVDDITKQILSTQKLTLESVPEAGKEIFLKDTANLSTGGTAIDVTDVVHPDNVLLAERVAEIIGLDICGIDIMAPDVKTPIKDNGGAIIEVNAAPGLRMHISPSEGKSRNVGEAIVNLMFPGKSEARIPIVAITGTNGKTSTSRLMSHIVQQQGFNVGFTTTDGIYLNGKQIERGDCTGPKSTQLVLHEPSVNFAVLECARGGILRSGLAFDQCDIGIVTNVAADHLGLKDIYTIEDMARVKSVIPQSVKKNGYAILNAKDNLVYKMREDLKCNIALFSLDDKNERVLQHCKNGGLAAVRDNAGNIIIREGDKQIEIENVKNIPFTMEGKAEFMVDNVLPVVIASHLLKIPLETLRSSLRSFMPSHEQAPGRLNMFKFNDVNVMVDYAHNAHSFEAFSGLMKNIEAEKTGIITGVGDRRDEDIKEIGRLAANMYDEIIIRIDKDTRGRSQEEIVRLIEEGIESVNPNISHTVIPDTKDALKYAIEHSHPGDYVVVNADNAIDTINIVKELQEEMETI